MSASAEHVEQTLMENIDRHIAKGGKLRAGSFFADVIDGHRCGCPIAVLASRNSLPGRNLESPMDTGARVLDIERQHVWAIVFGFDCASLAMSEKAVDSFLRDIQSNLVQGQESQTFDLEGCRTFFHVGARLRRKYHKHTFFSTKWTEYAPAETS